MKSWIFIVGAFVLAFGWFSIRFMRGVKKVQEAERKVDADIAQIEAMDTNRARDLALNLIDKDAEVIIWSLPIPDNTSQIISNLDKSVAECLTNYKKVTFPKTGTEIGADFLLFPTGIPEGVIIGVNKNFDYELVSRNGCSVIMECSKGEIREKYQSIFHYLLLVELF